MSANPPIARTKTSPLFASLPSYAGAWDGHDTAEKYRRVNAACPEPRDEGPRPDEVKP